MRKAFSPLCTAWNDQVKEFFTNLHGHQSKTLAMFSWGAIKAKSIVVQQVAEELLEEREAKCGSIEKRLRRFLANEKIVPEETWDGLLAQVLPYWQGKKVTLVIDITSFEKYAQVVYIGLLQHTRVLPLVWKVMPGQEKWDERLWQLVQEMFEKIHQYLNASACTVIGDIGFGSLAFIQLCQKQGWHYVVRVHSDEWVRRQFRGHYQDWQRLSDIVGKVGQYWAGPILLWQEHEFGTQLTAVWEEEHDEAWFLLSDEPAGRRRIKEYRLRMRVESTFQDMKSRGWQWEHSHVRALDHLDRMLLVLFLCFWWLMHLAASCITHGRRDRYDRHDRRDKGLLRLGRLYLLDIVRKTP